MGKPTGFLDYERVEATAVSPKERIKNYNEFHTPLSEDEQRKQSSRCMDCGVPFCQSGMTIKGMTSGCPLNNLIPEWNDLLYTGNWEQAYHRLHKTSNFPEFTSRVCPALCEKACTCGLNGKAVCTKENEMAIIEHAYAKGYAKANPPKVRTKKRIAVVGSGPAGLAVADQLNQRGHSVTVYERADRIGGLLRYGIPNMKLEKHIIDRKLDIMKEEGIEFVTNANVGENIKAKKLMDLLGVYPPKHFFCVSTDKAANPVNIMGASKRIMEDLVMAYNTRFKVTTARFANVAFSNGSLPDGWIHRLQKKQPLAAPSDVKRYFVSPEESGQICMLACILGNGGEVFFPKLGEDQMFTFSAICDDFVKAEGFTKVECKNDPEAKQYAAQMSYESDTYPVVYFKSDTTGEKAYEEFYIPGEKIDMERFMSLGVVCESTRRSMNEVNDFFLELEGIFQKDDFTKAEVVESIKKFISNFEHEEKGKNLDQKM